MTCWSYCPPKDDLSPHQRKGVMARTVFALSPPIPTYPGGLSTPPPIPPTLPKRDHFLFLLVHAPPGASTPPAADAQHASKATSTFSAAAAWSSIGCCPLVPGWAP